MNYAIIMMATIRLKPILPPGKGMHSFRQCPLFLGRLVSFTGQVVALATLFGAVYAADFVPFPVNWKVTAASPVDLSGLLDAPAGHAGFVTAKDGHFVNPDGSRLRFWGINATGSGALPTHANADLLAAGLARRGINCVRIHAIDRPGRIFPKDSGNTLSLDPAQLDRLDYFVAALKLRGIYVNFNLNVVRQYQPGDGVRDAESINNSYAKKITYFDSRILELQRDYARQLLTHLNPYTKTTYANEPAVALIEFVNENSIIAGWMEGDLDSIPRSYGADLTAQFNAWLGRNADAAALAGWRAHAGVVDGAPLPRLRSKEIATADQERFRTEARFYIELERNFFLGMAKFLRDELQVRSLFTGASDHAYARTGLPHLAASSLLDVVDGHKYWQYPNNIYDPVTKKRIGCSIGNSPMVDDPLNASVIEASRAAFAGKPFIVTEANHPFPNEYAAEGIPILAAYGRLQDWDGIFWYSLIHADLDEMDSSVVQSLDLAMDAARMAQFAPGALLFLRGDVAPARTKHTRTYTGEQVIDSIRVGGRPYFTPGFPKALALTQAVRIGSLDGAATGMLPAFEPSFPLSSDTGELTWYCEKKKRSGLVTINTPRSQAAMGFIGADRVQLENVALRMATPFSAVTLSSLNEASIGNARRLLLTATACTANTGQVWNDKRNSPTTWGGAPACTEPVRGRVTLRGLSGATKLRGIALDGGDQPAGEIIIQRLRADSDEWALDLNVLGATPAISWVIEVTR